MRPRRRWSTTAAGCASASSVSRKCCASPRWRWRTSTNRSPAAATPWCSPTPRRPCCTACTTRHCCANSARPGCSAAPAGPSATRAPTVSAPARWSAARSACTAASITWPGTCRCRAAVRPSSTRTGNCWRCWMRPHRMRATPGWYNAIPARWCACRRHRSHVRISWRSTGTRGSCASTAARSSPACCTRR